MQLYLTNIQAARRNGVPNPKFVWDPDRGITQSDVATLRNRYRTLRRAGIDAMYARWIIWDLIDAGTRARRAS